MKRFLMAALAAVVLCTSTLAFEYNRVSAGLIKGARLSRVSTTAIKVGVGFGENLGSYWEVTSTDTLVTTGYTLTGLTTSTNGVVQYIYIDRSASLFPTVVLTNSTTAPTWNDDLLGWYDGNNRCIGAVWIKADGTIAPFICSDDVTYQVSVPDFVTGSPSGTYGTYNSVNGSSFMPVNAHEVKLSVLAFDTAAAWSASETAIRSQGGTAFFDGASRHSEATAWVPFERGNKTFEWMAWSHPNATGVVRISLGGYRLER